MIDGVLIAVEKISLRSGEEVEGDDRNFHSVEDFENYLKYNDYYSNEFKQYKLDIYVDIRLVTLVRKLILQHTDTNAVSIIDFM
jgi:hypothetical protein